MTTNVFKDQEKFMQACDQSVTGDQTQFDMYIGLIAEEFKELQDYVKNLDKSTLDTIKQKIK